MKRLLVTYQKKSDNGTKLGQAVTTLKDKTTASYVRRYDVPTFR